jgi:hypothetical protein
VRWAAGDAEAAGAAAAPPHAAAVDDDDDAADDDDDESCASAAAENASLATVASGERSMLHAGEHSNLATTKLATAKTRAHR